MARGSLIEMETQIVIARNLGYVSSDTADRLAASSGEVSRLLHGLMQSLQPHEVPRKTGN
jgi:four helix bundle protein